MNDETTNLIIDEELTQAEYDYLDVLGALVYDYESIALKVDDEQFKIPRFIIKRFS